MWGFVCCHGSRRRRWWRDGVQTPGLVAHTLTWQLVPLVMIMTSWPSQSRPDLPYLGPHRWAILTHTVLCSQITLVWCSHQSSFVTVKTRICYNMLNWIILDCTWNKSCELNWISLDWSVCDPTKRSVLTLMWWLLCRSQVNHIKSREISVTRKHSLSLN